ncbi:MAG: POTRA domain-containing protein, partial [Bacteroidota bacterium]
MTQYLPKGEYLYAGAELKTANPKKLQPNARLQDELLLKVKQPANPAKPLIWLHYKMGPVEKQRGLKNWLKNKIGKPPVFYDATATEQSKLLMEKHLRDNGFFHAQVNADTTVEGHRITVNYHINGKGQYSIRNYILPPDSTKLLTLINQKTKRPLLRPGRPYSLTAIDAERLRLEQLGRNAGFYEFNQSALYFYLDTTVQETRQMDVYLAVNPPANEQGYQPHVLGNATIYPDYSLNQNDNTATSPDTIREAGWTMIQQRPIIELHALQEAIAQDSGALYSEKLKNQAINYLLDLGVFKFVNLRYRKDSINGTAVLHRDFYLTPSLNQDIGVEL